MKQKDSEGRVKLLKRDDDFVKSETNKLIQEYNNTVTDSRWDSDEPWMRLGHCIVMHKDDFLTRHDAHDDRLETEDRVDKQQKAYKEIIESFNNCNLEIDSNILSGEWHHPLFGVSKKLKNQLRI